MSKINTLSAGYKSHPSKIRSSNNRPPVIKSPTIIDAVDLAEKIKIWHIDGNLSTKGLNYLITTLQKIS